MHKITNIANLCKDYPYLERVAAPIQGIVDREKRKFDTDQTKDFAFVSANLENFIPTITPEEIRNTYMNLHFNRTLMLIEAKAEASVHHLNTNFDEIIKDKQPKIFCTYHLGPYRAPIALLIKKQIDFVILLDKKTFDRQATVILEQVDNLKQQYRSPSKVELLNVEKNNVIYKIINYIKQKISVLAYIDGNTGGKGVYHRKEQLQTTIDFLNNKILARNGLAAISYITKIPIYPIIAYRPKRNDVPPFINFEQAIIPDKNVSLKSYKNDATKALYQILEDYVKIFFDQWEPWFYIHKYMIPNVEKTIEDKSIEEKGNKKNTVFNVKHFSLFKIEEDCFLLDKRAYLSYPITGNLFKELKILEKKKSDDTKIGSLKWFNGIKFFAKKPQLTSVEKQVLHEKKILIYE